MESIKYKYQYLEVFENFSKFPNISFAMISEFYKDKIYKIKYLGYLLHLT